MQANVRVFLKSGNYFDIVADKISCDTAGNNLTKLSCKNIVNGRPLFVDLEQVEAVVEFFGKDDG